MTAAADTRAGYVTPAGVAALEAEAVIAENLALKAVLEDAVAELESYSDDMVAQLARVRSKLARDLGLDGKDGAR